VCQNTEKQLREKERVCPNSIAGNIFKQNQQSRNNKMNKYGSDVRVTVV